MMEGARPSPHGVNKYFCPCRGSDEIMNYYLNSGQSKKVEDFVYVLRTRLLQFLESLASQPDKSLLKAHDHLPKRLTAQVMEWPSLVEDCRSDSMRRIVHDLAFNWPVLQQLILSLSIPKEIPGAKNGEKLPQVLAVTPSQPPVQKTPLSLADSISKIDYKMLKEVLGTLEFYDVSSSPYSEKDYVFSHSDVSSNADFYFDPSFLEEEIVLPKNKDNCENSRIGALIDGVSHMSFSNMVDLCSSPSRTSKCNKSPPPETPLIDYKPPEISKTSCSIKKPSDVIPPAPVIPPANRRYLHLRDKLRWRMRVRHAELRKNANNVKNTNKEEKPVDTPKNIEDVVNFIEGKNQVVNEKRLAKKARQREKKLRALEEQRLAEEEAARKLEEQYQLQMQKEAARAKKKKKKESRMKKLANAQPVPNSVPHCSRNTIIGSRGSNIASTFIENKDSTVTIRRVNLPQKNPSTVTISFSASDDNISKIIGMLKSDPFNSPSVEVQKSNASLPVSVCSVPLKSLVSQKPAPASVPPPAPKPTPKSTRPLQDPNTIKINQIVARMAQNPDASLCGDIQLPSGITISRVDPGKVRSEFSIGGSSRTYSEPPCEVQHQIINVTTNRQRCDDPIPQTSKISGMNTFKLSSDSNNNKNLAGKTLVHPVETKAKNKRKKK